MDDLVALAKLYGYVRFFHPSDEATGVDWERFLAAAVERVEPAGDAAQLSAALTEVFAPIAPTLAIWAGDETAAPPEIAKVDAALEYTAWRHYGVDVSGQTPGRSLYTSRRIQAHPETPSDEIPKPGAFVVKSLGGGVSCRVPLTLSIDAEKHTLPRAQGEIASPKRPEWWSASGKDRSARLAGVIVAWNVFEHFYPYFDVTDTDWKGAPPDGAGVRRQGRG